MVVKLSTQGRLTIRKEIRDQLGWPPGTEISSEVRGDEGILRRVRTLPRTTLRDLAGCLDYDGPAKNLEEMEGGIAEGARRSLELLKA